MSSNTTKTMVLNLLRGNQGRLVEREEIETPRAVGIGKRVKEGVIAEPRRAVAVAYRYTPSSSSIASAATHLNTNK